jgi:hypothetical protein
MSGVVGGLETAAVGAGAVVGFAAVAGAALVGAVVGLVEDAGAEVAGGGGVVGVGGGPLLHAAMSRDATTTADCAMCVWGVRICLLDLELKITNAT